MYRCSRFLTFTTITMKKVAALITLVILSVSLYTGDSSRPHSPLITKAQRAAYWSVRKDRRERLVKVARWHDLHDFTSRKPGKATMVQIHAKKLSTVRLILDRWISILSIFRRSRQSEYIGDASLCRGSFPRIKIPSESNKRSFICPEQSTTLVR